MTTNAPADSPKVSASVATARGISRKKAAVLKTKDAPRAAAPRITANRGPARIASCQADGQHVLRGAPGRRQLMCERPQNALQAEPMADMGPAAASRWTVARGT